MNKIIKRTLIALFSVVFLVCTALFLAACGEEESGTPHYKVTLDYEQAQGTVVLSAPADEKGYVKDEVVTVTVAANLGYTQTAPTVKANNDDVTLTEGVGTFSVKGDTTVTVTFTADTNPDFLSGKTAYNFKGHDGYTFNSGKATPIGGVGSELNYTISNGVVTIEGSPFTVKGTTFFDSIDTFYVSDVVNVVTVNENDTANVPFSFVFDTVTVDPDDASVTLNFTNAVYNGNVATASYNSENLEGSIGLTYALGEKPTYMYSAEVDMVNLTSVSEKSAVIVDTAATASTQYRAIIMLGGRQYMTLLEKSGDQYNLVFDYVGGENAATEAGTYDFFWQGEKKVDNQITTYKVTLSGATYSMQNNGEGETLVGDFSNATLVVENLGTETEKVITAEDYKVTVRYDADKNAKLVRLSKTVETVETDIYGGSAVGEISCVKGEGNTFTITSVTQTPVEGQDPVEYKYSYDVYTVTLSGAIPANWTATVALDSTEVQIMTTKHESERSYYGHILYAPDKQEIVGSFILYKWTGSVYVEKTYQVKSCEADGWGTMALTVTTETDEEIIFTMQPKEIYSEDYDIYVAAETTDAKGNSVTFAVADNTPSTVLEIVYNEVSFDITAVNASLTNVNVFTVFGTYSGAYKAQFKVTYVPAAGAESDPTVIIEVEEITLTYDFTYQKEDEESEKTYVATLALSDDFKTITDIVSIEIKNEESEKPNTAMLIDRDSIAFNVNNTIVMFDAKCSLPTLDGEGSEEYEISVCIDLTTFEMSSIVKEIEIVDWTYIYTITLKADVRDKSIKEVVGFSFYNYADPSFSTSQTETVLTPDDFTLSEGKIVYNKEGLQFELSNLTEIYTEEYDTLDWIIDIKSSVHVYSIMTGFLYTADGKYGLSGIVNDFDGTFIENEIVPLQIVFAYPIPVDPITWEDGIATLSVTSDTLTIKDSEEEPTITYTITVVDGKLVVTHTGKYAESLYKEDTAYGGAGTLSKSGFVAVITFDQNGKPEKLQSFVYGRYSKSDVEGSDSSKFEDFAISLDNTSVADGVITVYANDKKYTITVVGGALNVTYEASYSINGEKFYDIVNEEYYEFGEDTVTISGASGSRTKNYTIVPATGEITIQDDTPATFTFNGTFYSNSDKRLFAVGSDLVNTFTVGADELSITFTGNSYSSIDVATVVLNGNELYNPQLNGSKLTYSGSALPEYNFTAVTIELDIATMTTTIVGGTLYNSTGVGYTVQIIKEGDGYKATVQISDYYNPVEITLVQGQVRYTIEQSSLGENASNDFYIEFADLGTDFGDFLEYFGNATVSGGPVSD